MNKRLFKFVLCEAYPDMCTYYQPPLCTVPQRSRGAMLTSCYNSLGMADQYDSNRGEL